MEHRGQDEAREPLTRRAPEETPDMHSGNVPPTQRNLLNKLEDVPWMR